MALSFCSFSSGSSGNCYLVKTERTAVLIDAGISRRKIMAGLEKTRTAVESLEGVLISHEHSDHVKSLNTFLNDKSQSRVYANEKTWKRIKTDSDSGKISKKKRNFVTGDAFWIGDILVKTFPVSHDAADPVGYTLIHGGKRISVVTDTGCIGEGLFHEVRDADILVLEANHDEDMLKFGRYPWALKQRILGERGHLSNTAAGKAILNILLWKRKERCVLLAHLSGENNFPEMAEQTVKNILEEKKYYKGRDLYLHTIRRDEISFLYEV